MASFPESRPALPPCDVGTKRKHGVNQAMEEYKENLGPAGNSRRKRPKLEQPVKVKLIYTISLHVYFSVHNASDECKRDQLFYRKAVESTGI